MKKLLVLSAVCVFTLSSFTSKEEVVVKKQFWKAVCADGSIGGYFACDCTQSQANQIAGIMCD